MPGPLTRHIQSLLAQDSRFPDLDVDLQAVAENLHKVNAPSNMFRDLYREQQKRDESHRAFALAGDAGPVSHAILRLLGALEHDAAQDWASPPQPANDFSVTPPVRVDEG